MLVDLESCMQKNEAQPPIYIINKNKLKVDKRLKYKSQYHKSPREEHRQENLRYIPCSNIFSDLSPRAKDIKERINKWDLIKINSFCSAKENISKTKMEPNIWENIFANDTLDQGLISKI